MKSWIILIVAAAAVTAAASVAVPLISDGVGTTRPGFPAPAKPDGPPPVVQVEGDETYNFTPMAKGAEGKHAWLFRNTGKGKLELRNLGSDCSCTIPQIGDPKKNGAMAKEILPIPPGGSETVELSWKTNNAGDGAFRKSARIGTNDPNRPTVVLTIEGEVHPAVALIPATSVIGFDNVFNDEDAIRSVIIASRDRPTTKVTKLVSSNPGLVAVEARTSSADALKFHKLEAAEDLIFTIKAGSKLGAFDEQVLIGTDHPQRPQMSVRVIGRVTGPVTLDRSRVLMRDVPSAAGASQVLMISARTKSPIRFEVASKPTGLDVAIQPLSETQYRMTVKVIPGTPAGTIADEIVLKTDHPRASEIRVPVDILVQAAG